ncbi:MAG: HNH endonuclease, partial [Nitrosopumilus sp.]|nr:HNH endonuclease [Nitrosopumilus sp.]
GEDCSNQIINTNSNLDVFVNAFSGNVEPSNFIVIFFSKVFDFLVRPSSVILLFSILATGIVLNTLKKLKKSTNKARKGFSQVTRERILRKQNDRCIYCRKNLTVIDYHHKNGNRSDNRENNCQALCPNCHAIKTRKNLIKN